MNTMHDRIRKRLKETHKSQRRASLDGGLSEDAIVKMLKKPEQSQTLATIAKLAIGLETTAEWLAYGIRFDDAAISNPSMICVERRLLREAVRFVLEQAGTSPEEATLVADIFPAALEGPAVDVVDRDPFLSFRVHLQLQVQRSGH